MTAGVISDVFMHIRQSMHGPLIIGITGIIGSGKSTVSRYLLAEGFTVLDADQVAKDQLDNEQVKAAIIERLGADCYPDGRVDRAAIADRVFGHAENKKWLEELIHPRVQAEFRRLTAEFKGPFLFWDVPLLFEGTMWEKCDRIMLVSAPYEVRLQRALAGQKFSREDFKSRNDSQIPLNEKEKRSDFIIDNAESTENTYQQIDKVIEELNRLSPERTE